MTTAVVTGASSGIGLEIARCLASRGHSVVLVSPEEERLATVAQNIERDFAVPAEVWPADLAEPADVSRLAARVGDRSRPVEWLVNNAGIGAWKGFRHSAVGDEQALIDIMITAPMRLTHAVLPGMLERRRGRALFTASLVAFFPRGSYSAAKAWQVNFSEQLSARHRRQGVHVTALCPGFTRTEIAARGGADLSVIPEWAWLDAAAVAAAGVEGCEAGRALVIPGGGYKALYASSRLLPRALLRKEAFRKNLSRAARLGLFR